MGEAGSSWPVFLNLALLLPFGRPKVVSTTPSFTGGWVSYRIFTPLVPLSSLQDMPGVLS